jgi:hypothetical protein
LSQQVILHASCFAIAEHEIKQCHSVICDPPYSPHVHANITSAGTMGDASHGWHRQELEFDALTPELLAFIARATVLVSGWSCIFSDIESSHLWRQAIDTAGSEYIRSVPVLEVTRDGAFAEHEPFETDDGDFGYSFALPWRRWSQPQKTGDRPTTGAELVTHAWGRAGTRKGWNGPGNLTAYDRKGLRGADKHRTEKPIGLMLDLVSWYSNPGERVIDFCAGAGTTGLACKLLDRDFWGTEAIERWAGHGMARLVNPLSDRDRKLVKEWLLSTRAEARDMLNRRRTKDKNGKYTDEGTRARAERRLADCDTVERMAA